MPSVERILQLEPLEHDIDRLRKDYGSSDGVSIAQVFWNVASIFSVWLVLRD